MHIWIGSERELEDIKGSLMIAVGHLGQLISNLPPGETRSLMEQAQDRIQTMYDGWKKIKWEPRG